MFGDTRVLDGSGPFVAGSLSPRDVAFASVFAMLVADFFSKTKLALNKPACWSETETTGCRSKASSSVVKLVTGCASNSIWRFNASDLIFNLSSSAITTFLASSRRASSWRSRTTMLRNSSFSLASFPDSSLFAPASFAA